MKCPKCKKELKEWTSGNMVVRQDILICGNEKCGFYGIERLDLRKKKE